jgi:hypothetical protein
VTVDVASYRLGRCYRHIEDRVAAIADQAATLVTREMRISLNPAQIVVAEERDVIDLVHQAERSAIGTTRNPLRRARPQLGHTAITDRGVRIIINATRLHQRHDSREIDATVVHELVHVAQISRPDGRERIASNIRNNYGIDRLSWREARAANRLMDEDERQAANLERLAQQLTL